jgi:hypothetical protein
MVVCLLYIFSLGEQNGKKYEHLSIIFTYFSEQEHEWIFITPTMNCLLQLDWIAAFWYQNWTRIARARIDMTLAKEAEHPLPVIGFWTGSERR